MSKEISYPTHLVGLWMRNDEGTWDDMLELAGNTNDLESALRCYFEDRMPAADGLANDLICAVIDDVDWGFLANELNNEIDGRYK